MPSLDRQGKRSHVLAVRVPTQIYEAVQRLARTPAQRAAWLRAAIIAAMRHPPSKPPLPPSSGGKENTRGVSGKFVKAAKTKRLERKLIEADVAVEQRRKAEHVTKLIDRLGRPRRVAASA